VVKRQAIACQACSSVVAYVYDEGGRAQLRHAYGAPLLTVTDNAPTVADMHSQWVVIDIEDELADTAESIIEVECNCAENGSPRQWSFPLRATLGRLGDRRSFAI
jgi:hypothetical protein